MNDYEFQKCTRKCAVTGMELAPGTEFYSVLLVQNGEIIRQDYSLAAWQGEPANALGSWRAKVPDSVTPKVSMAPHDLIVQYFEELQNLGNNPELAYVLALLMIRRKIARLEESLADEDGQQTLVIYCPKREQEYRVTVMELSPQRVEEIQSEISRLLFTGNAA